MKYLSALFSVILLLALGGQPIFAQSGDDLFQQALQKERSEGDLEGAISLYQKIVDNYTDVRRALVARALIQIGRSYERLGVDLVAEARQAYEQVVRYYADQPDMVAEARSRLEAMEAAVAAAARPDEPKALTMRKVIPWSFYGAISPDGRYFSYVNWTYGNMAVYDTKTREYRDVTDEGTWEPPNHYGDISIWSPDSKQIAYCWFSGGNQELRIVNVDGGEPRILAPFSEAGVPYPRAWTSDGKYILATVALAVDGDRDLVLVDVETGSTRSIKRFEGIHNRNMSLSPDGQYVVYETLRTGQEKPRDLHIISIDNRVDQSLVEHPADDHRPHWTPDGRGVVFKSDRSGTPGLWYVSVSEGRKTSEPRLIQHRFGGNPYGFTDDGTYYYSARRPGNNIFVAELDVDLGTLQTTRERVSERNVGTNRTPFWSPDGSQLAYFSERDDRSTTLVVRDMQSGEERDINMNLWNLEANSTSPRWSPDGKAILVTGILVTAVRQGKPGLYLIDIETERMTRPTRIVDGRFGKVFTPDGDDLIFVRVLDPKKVSGRINRYTGTFRSEIIQRNLASGTERVLSDSPLRIKFLEISPDGSQLAYFEGDGNGNFDLVVMSLKDGSTRTLWSKSVFSEWVGLEWMPDGAHLLLATYLAEEEEQQLYLVDVNSGERKPIGQPRKGKDQIYHVDVHPNGTTITFGRNDLVSETWAIENLVFDQ